jgi:hypothetical protein
LTSSAASALFGSITRACSAASRASVNCAASYASRASFIRPCTSLASSLPSRSRNFFSKSAEYSIDAMRSRGTAVGMPLADLTVIVSALLSSISPEYVCPSLVLTTPGLANTVAAQSPQRSRTTGPHRFIGVSSRERCNVIVQDTRKSRQVWKWLVRSGGHLSLVTRAAPTHIRALRVTN